MVSLREIHSELDDAWDEIAKKHNKGSFFHRVHWLSILEMTQSLPLIRLGFFEGEELVGILPLFLKKVWPLRIAASPFVVEDTPYLGIVIADELLDDALNLLNEYVKRKGIHYLRMLQNEKMRVELNDKYTLIEKHTHILDLNDSEEEIWKQLEGRCRTAVRKAEKSGIKIVVEESRECIETYYVMLQKLYQNQNMMTPNTLEFYYRLWDEFFPNNLRILTARYEEEAVAGVILIADGRRWYYLNGTSLPKFNHLCPNNLIQWEAIRLAKANGGERYDFVGSDIERLAKFKKSFGGELNIYSCLEWSASPLVSKLRERYPQIKMMIGRFKSRLCKVNADA